MSTKSFIRFSGAPVLAGFSGGEGLLTEVIDDYYAMPMEPLDNIRFIFDFSQVSDFAYTDIKVALLRGETVAYDDLAIVVDGLYWTVSIPEELAEGCYRFLIYDQTFNVTDWVTTGTECELDEEDNPTGYQLISQERTVDDEPTNTVLFVSNIFQYGLWKTSGVIEFRGRQNGWGFDYETDTNFYQRFRLEFVLNRPKYPEIKKIYRQSNGVYRHANVNIDKKVMLDTDYLDEKTHDALSVALKHDELYLNGLPYFSGEEYEPDWVEASTDSRYFELAKASTELYVQGYDQRNNTCAGIDSVGFLPPECIEVSPGDSILIG